MKSQDVVDELIRIRRDLTKLRLKNKQANWFAHGISAIECLVAGMEKSVEHVRNITNE